MPNLKRREDLLCDFTLVLPRRCPQDENLAQRTENIENFAALSREGLNYMGTEKRILLYQTQLGEKIYLQYPGKESARLSRNYPLDARPVLIKRDGSFLEDMNFKQIWDVLDVIGHQHQRDLDLVGSIFARMAYMKNYMHNEADYLIETVDNAGNVLETGLQHLVWNSIVFDEDDIYTINDIFSDIPSGISMEAFIYYNELLVQNEDCKYSYLKGADWDHKVGRVNTCMTHLSIISHLNGSMSLSKLIDGFQRSRGTCSLPVSRISEACGTLVEVVRNND